MRKLIALALAFLLMGCVQGGFSAKLKSLIDKERNSVNVAEITTFDWDYLRIVHPYESRTLFGEKLEQKDDKSCLWVFAKEDVVQEKFEIAREDAECIDLPTKTFSRGDSIFLIRNGELVERKKFTLPKRK